MDNSDLILTHYKNISIIHGKSMSYSMQDLIIRKKEFRMIYYFLKRYSSKMKNVRVLEVGCGNGYCLEKLSLFFPDIYFEGIDFCPEAINIAKTRTNRNSVYKLANVSKMPYKNEYFDIIISVRCLINILTASDQKIAMDEIGRVLTNNGYLLLIECFKDGHKNYNDLRNKIKLPSIVEAYHNVYLDKDIFEKINTNFSIENKTKKNRYGFKINFLSTHYLFSRVIFPLFVKNPNKIRNSIPMKIVSIFPNIGNYSPLQFVLLKKQL